MKFISVGIYKISTFNVIIIIFSLGCDKYFLSCFNKISLLIPEVLFLQFTRFFSNIINFVSYKSLTSMLRRNN